MKFGRYHSTFRGHNRLTNITVHREDIIMHFKSVLVFAALVAGHMVAAEELTLKIRVPGAHISEEATSIKVEHHITVEGLKEIIERESGIVASKQKLFLAGKELENEYELEHYGIVDGTLLEMTVQMDSYFGVDPNDKEAVRQVQQELSHNKFKELFGEDANIEDLDFHHESHDDKAPKKGLKHILRETVEKLFDFLNPNKGPKKEAAESASSTTSAPAAE